MCTEMDARTISSTMCYVHAQHIELNMMGLLRALDDHDATVAVRTVHDEIVPQCNRKGRKHPGLNCSGKLSMCLIGPALHGQRS